MIRRTTTSLALCAWCLVPCASASEVTYFYTDPQGNVLATADAQGNILTTRDYHPYGADAMSSPASGPGYTGHIEDADVDPPLIYMQQRYYDPVAARFLSVDPVGVRENLEIHFNRYRYANGNPISNVDPDGRQSWCTPGNCGAQSYLSAANRAQYLRENYEMVFTVKGAYGMGVETNFNFGQGNLEVNYLPAAKGLFMALQLQPKDSLTFNIVAHPVPARFAMTMTALEIGAVASAGVDVKFDPGGKVEVQPKGGVGVGAWLQVAPAINVFNWKLPPPPPPPPAPIYIFDRNDTATRGAD